MRGKTPHNKIRLCPLPEVRWSFSASSRNFLSPSSPTYLSSRVCVLCTVLVPRTSRRRLAQSTLGYGTSLSESSSQEPPPRVFVNRMASDSWNARLLATSSRRHQSRSDLFYGGHDEIEGNEDSRPEFLCPFCAEDFDIVGLCCHIDEDHPIEAKNGVCPVCAKRVGLDLVGHITVQHGSFFKAQRKRRLRKGGSNSTFTMLRKDMRDGNLQSLLGGSSFIISSSNNEPDPLLSSFIFKPPPVDEPAIVELFSSNEASSVLENSEEEFVDSDLVTEKSKGKLYRTRIKRRGLGRVSLCKNCYCPQCSMTSYKSEKGCLQATDCIV